jgi:hypothetical protein
MTFSSVHPQDSHETSQLFFPVEGSVRDPILDRYRRVLTAMHETPLASPSDAIPSERYRFLWLRTRHRPVAIRAERQAAVTRLAVRVLNGKGGYDAGVLERSDELALHPAQWDLLQQELKAARFWSLPRQGNHQGLDGAEWVLEGVRPGEHRLVHRWCPGFDTGDAAFRAVCLALLEMAGLGAIAQPIY